MLVETFRNVETSKVLTWYNVASLVAVASFPVARGLAWGWDYKNGIESSAIAGGLFLWMARGKKSVNVEDSINALPFYGKAIVVGLSYLDSPGLCIAYLCLFFALFTLQSLIPSKVISSAPSYIRVLNSETFFSSAFGKTRSAMAMVKDNVNDLGKPQGKKSTRRLLLHITAPWSSASRESVAVFRGIAKELRTTEPGLVLGTLDASRWPEVAEFLDMSVAATSLQIPSLVVFEEGKEARRFPPIHTKDGHASFGVRKKIPADFLFTRPNVIKAYYDFFNWKSKSKAIKEVDGGDEKKKGE